MEASSIHKAAFSHRSVDKFPHVNLGDYSLHFYAGSFSERTKLSVDPAQDFLGLWFSLKGAFHLDGLPSGAMKENHFNMIRMPKGCCDYVFPKGDFTALAIHFKKPYLESAAGSFPMLSAFLAGHSPAQMAKRHPIISSDILDIFQHLHDQYDQLPEHPRQSYLKIKVREILFESLDQLTSGYDPGSVVLRYDHDKIAAARDYLLQHLQEPFSLPDLEHITGLNKDKLEKGFRDLYGTTVHAFLIEARMKNAMALLRDTLMPIPKITRTVGYKSVTSFTRIFKNKFGHTPGAFRSVVKGNHEAERVMKEM